MLLLRGAGQVMGYKRRERAAGGCVCCSDGEGGWPTGAGLLAEEMKFSREQSAVTYRLGWAGHQTTATQTSDAATRCAAEDQKMESASH